MSLVTRIMATLTSFVWRLANRRREAEAASWQRRMDVWITRPEVDHAGLNMYLQLRQMQLLHRVEVSRAEMKELLQQLDVRINHAELEKVLRREINDNVDGFGSGKTHRLIARLLAANSTAGRPRPEWLDASWFHTLAFMVPKTIREPWYGDLCEDRRRLVALGRRRLVVELLTACQLAVLLGAWAKSVIANRRGAEQLRRRRPAVRAHRKLRQAVRSNSMLLPDER